MTIVSDEFSLLPLTEIADKIKSGSVSSLSVTEAQLRRIARLEPDLHAYAQVMETSALESTLR